MLLLDIITCLCSVTCDNVCSSAKIHRLDIVPDDATAAVVAACDACAVEEVDLRSPTTVYYQPVNTVTAVPTSSPCTPTSADSTHSTAACSLVSYSPSTSPHSDSCPPHSDPYSPHLVLSSPSLYGHSQQPSATSSTSDDETMTHRLAGAADAGVSTEAPAR